MWFYKVLTQRGLNTFAYPTFQFFIFKTSLKSNLNVISLYDCATPQLVYDKKNFNDMFAIVTFQNIKNFERYQNFFISLPCAALHCSSVHFCCPPVHLNCFSNHQTNQIKTSQYRHHFAVNNIQRSQVVGRKFITS